MYLGAPDSVFAHVTVNPRASKPDSEEKYIVRVPTEKPVATTSVELEIPAGVMVSQVSAPEGATHEEKRENNRVVVIVWTKEIKPRESAALGFVAKNPASGDITWKVHQRYDDGTVSDWTRDRHLGPELREFQNLQFGHTNRKIQMVGDRGAYVISNYTLRAKMGDRDIDSGGLETLVLLKSDDGAWKIRHSHTSSRPVRRPAGQ